MDNSGNYSRVALVSGNRVSQFGIWLEVGERQLARTKLVQQASKKIEVARKCMKIAQDRQKYYADHRTRDLEFQEEDRVFLQISPQRPSMRNQKQGKLSPRFMRSYKIIERVGPLAYRLALPNELAGFHDVFHVSQLRKYILDPWQSQRKRLRFVRT
ncbi:uncharacterized protein LOC127812737 [Diospyros lotus]|uniref:uncharacterized protein LOC127812737 n=1 Tax=Diospyros lotus TaxID=55363 RepID=UPI0022512BA1|nr:uncharacterized protein LOC127812737 [Diospyros lotus]